MKLFTICLMILLSVSCQSRRSEEFVSYIRSAEELYRLGDEKERRYEEDPDALVTVAECNDTASAYIIKGVLESNEIPVEIFGDGLSETLGVGKHTVPIRIMVRRRDKETAEKLINE